MRGRRVDGLPAERERKILVLRPHRQQVAVIRAARLAGLAGDVHHLRSIPVRDVEDLAIRRAVGFDGAGAAAALDRAEIEFAQQGMPECARVLLAPAAIERPCLHVPGDDPKPGLGIVARRVRGIRPSAAAGTRRPAPGFVDRRGAAVPRVHGVPGGHVRAQALDLWIL